VSPLAERSRLGYFRGLDFALRVRNFDGDRSINERIAMFRRPDADPLVSPSGPLLQLIAFVMLAALPPGCGDVSCPDSFVDTDGVCLKRAPADPNPAPTAERCDGVDNDLDDGVDENWPELGKPCGEGAGVGECVAGVFVCAGDGAGTVCEGAVGPTAEVCDGKDNDCDGVPDNGPAEVCDGKDNDCDGLVDEGVLAVKKEEVFGGLGSVAAVDGGFAVTRAFPGQLQFETYDPTGARTGKNATFNTIAEVAFLESDGDGSEVYLTWGKLTYHAAEAHVDSNLIPTIIAQHQLHESWDQSPEFIAYRPPFHPRVVASSRRLAGFEDPLTFSIIAFGDDLAAVAQQAPTMVPDVLLVNSYDAAGFWIVWEANQEIEGAWLLNDGRLALGAPLGSGSDPALAVTRDGPAMVSLLNGDVQLAELDGLTFECRAGSFCNASLPGDNLLGPADDPADLAYHAGSDTWFVVAGRQIIAVGRDGTNAVVKQLDERTDLADFPNLVDVAVSGDTVAIMQSSPSGDSALTFLGCF
jgi:hypothetical protein